MRDKAARDRIPRNTMDPLAVLPVEVAEMILQHLNFREMVYVV